MAAPIDFDGAWREIEDELTVAGMNLRGLCSSSSVDELISHLVRVERVLKRVWQEPPMFVKNALVPTMTALIKDELLKHPHENIQVVVASCLNQITRITAPTQPYPDNQMKDVFRLFMVALRQLSSGAGDNFFRAVQILGAMVRMKTAVIMMDLDIEPMIVEMFQIFFDIIRPNHSVTIFKYMVAVMSLVIEESGEVSLELLRPLLESVKMDNKKSAYIAWELGRFVIEECSTKLQPYIREAVKKMKLEVNDYAEIVVSLCQDTSNENMLEEENTAAAALSGDCVSKLDVASEAERVGPSPQLNDGNGNENMPDNENSPEKLGSDIGAANDAEIVHEKRRGRKPNSLMKPEEGYEHIWTIGDNKSCKVSRDSDKKTRKSKTPSDSSHGEFNDQQVPSGIRREILPSEPKGRVSKRTKKTSTGEVIAGLSTVDNKGEGSPSENVSVEKFKSALRQPDSFDKGVSKRTKKTSTGEVIAGLSTIDNKGEGSPSGNVSVEKFKSALRQPNSFDKGVSKRTKKTSPGEVIAGLSTVDKGEGSHSGTISVEKLKSALRQPDSFDKGVSKRTKKTSGEVIAGLSTVDKREGSHSGNILVEKFKSALRQPDRWKEIRDEIISQSNELRDVADKMVESPVSNTAKAKTAEHLAPEEEEMSTGPNVEYGDEMVNVRIKIWWPMDKTFYTGTVEAFDPLTKKHKIRYDDDEEEVLDLREERWELFNEKLSRQIQSSQKQETHVPSPVKDTVETEKKITKRKAGSSRKQLHPSSSKISKSEGRSFVEVKNEPDEEDEDEMPIFLFKSGKSRAGKKRSKTMK